MKKGIGGHQSAKAQTDTWLTPPEIIKSLGEFDLDPCVPVNMPWPTAKKHFNINDDGLIQDWFGRVWMNPPYGNACAKWLRKMAGHGNGIALIFARTETKMFFESIWEQAESLFFFEGRLHFYNEYGVRAKANAGAPTCLIAYGENNSDAIEDSGLRGKHVRLGGPQMIIVGVSPTWKSVVSIALTRCNGKAKLQEIYDIVQTIAPDKIANNSFYQEKIRQTLQKYFKRVDIGIYSQS